MSTLNSYVSADLYLISRIGHIIESSHADLVLLNRRSKNLNGEWLTAQPETSSMLVQEDVEFIILASDGLWDSLKRYENLVDVILNMNADDTNLPHIVGTIRINLNKRLRRICSAEAVDFVRKQLMDHGTVQVH